MECLCVCMREAFSAFSVYEIHYKKEFYMPADLVVSSAIDHSSHSKVT